MTYLFYDNKFLSILSSYRLEYFYLTHYDINLLGQKMGINLNSALDNSFIVHYLQEGILFSLFMGICYYCLLKKMLQYKKYKVICVILSILIYFVFENNLNYFYYNYIIIYLFEENKKL